MQSMHLPQPDKVARQHSQKLQDKIIQTAMASRNGAIDFAHFMNMALYEPGLGYYSAGTHKFGEQGDFITAPEISPLFAQTLANPVANVLQQMDQGNIIEFGAGSGILAVNILRALEALNQLPEQYFIVELSASLQQRQQQLIQQQIPHLQHKVCWLNQLPAEKINAAVIANEVLDAMPVQRFVINNNQIQQLFINSKLELQALPASDDLIHAVQHIENELHYQFPDGYSSEINFFIQPWLQSIGDSLNQAAIFLIDYGYHRAEYYSPERHMGTLMCYFQHRSHDNPLWYPGLQDITAFIDFTAVAEAAVQTGFDVDGYTSQANFLLASGLGEIVERQFSDNIQTQLALSQQVKSLTLPSEMGERFKVMALAKNLPQKIPGFELRDFRDRL